MRHLVLCNLFHNLGHRYHRFAFNHRNIRMACTEQQHTPSVKRRSLGNMDILMKLPPTPKPTTSVATYKKCVASRCTRGACDSCLGYCPQHLCDLYRAEKIDINESTGEVLMRDTQDELTSFLEYTSSTSPVKDGGDSARHQQSSYWSDISYTHEQVDKQQSRELHEAALHDTRLLSSASAPSTRELVQDARYWRKRLY